MTTPPGGAATTVPETTISGATLAMGLSGIAIVNSGCGGAMGLSE